jgi:hypothetical protein
MVAGGTPTTGRKVIKKALRDWRFFVCFVFASVVLYAERLKIFIVIKKL